MNWQKKISFPIVALTLFSGIVFLGYYLWSTNFKLTVNSVSAADDAGAGWLVGDLDNNGVANDRGDGICAISQYLALACQIHHFTNPDKRYIYDINGDLRFDKRDILNLVAHYLEDQPTQTSSSQQCLPLDTASNYLAETGPYPSNDNVLRGVGQCHYLQGLGDGITWFYQTSTPEVWWSTLNPQENVFKIKTLTDYIEKTSQSLPDHSKFLVELYLAGYSKNKAVKKYPQWLVDQGAVYVARGDDGTFVPWDPIFKQALSRFLTEVDQGFKRAWGADLAKKPSKFEGIVVWSGGYYGEMQILAQSNRQKWEALGAQELSTTTSDPQFKQKFDKLWTKSVINLASLYAQKIDSKIRLMLQLGGGLYDDNFSWQGSHWQSNETMVDNAAARELVASFPNRFYFKYNGWDTGMSKVHQWTLFGIKQTGRSLGVGYEVGHAVRDPQWMVNYALGVNAAGVQGLPANFKVDFACIQPDFINNFGSQLDRLIRNLNYD